MKQEQIIEAARELFSIYGYKKVSMDEIASKAKVTKKTIYSYFKDKDELFQYFVLEEINKMKVIIEENEKQDVPFIDKIHKTVYELIKFRKNATFIAKMTNDAQNLRNEAVIQKLKLIDDEVQSYIKCKLEYAMKEGNIKECDVDLASFIIYKIYIALMYEYKENRKDLDEKVATDEILNILRNGILTKK